MVSFERYEKRLLSWAIIILVISEMYGHVKIESHSLARLHSPLRKRKKTGMSFFYID